MTDNKVHKMFIGVHALNVNTGNNSNLFKKRNSHYSLLGLAVDVLSFFNLISGGLLAGALSVVSFMNFTALVSLPALIVGNVLAGTLSVVSLADLTALVSFPAFISGSLSNGCLLALVS